MFVCIFTHILNRSACQAEGRTQDSQRCNLSDFDVITSLTKVTSALRGLVTGRESSTWCSDSTGKIPQHLSPPGFYSWEPEATAHFLTTYCLLRN